MTDFNEKLNSSAEINDEQLKNVSGGIRPSLYLCEKCENLVYDEDIQTDEFGKMWHKGCGGAIFGPSQPNSGMFIPIKKIIAE